MATAEGRLFQKYFSDISSALTANHQSCLVLANLCCSRYLIDRQVRNQIQEEKGIYAANTLLKCLEAKVVVEPSCFEAILDVLKEECMLCAIIENMQKDYKDVERLEPTADLPHSNIVITELQDKIQSITDMFSQIEGLCSKFDYLVTTMKTAMRSINVEDLKTPLESKLSRASNIVQASYMPLLRKVKTVEEFFNFILQHKFCGFLNFSLLTIYAEKHGSDEVKKEIKDYNSAFQNFAKAVKMDELLRAILNKPELPKPFAPIGLPILEFTLEESWYQRSYNVFMEILSGFFSCSNALLFNSIEENCIKISYCLFPDILESVMQDLENSKHLKMLGINVVLHTEQKQKTSRPSTHSIIMKQCVTCPICKEIFNDPKVLSCHHSFCLQCLSFVKGIHSGKIECPMCRKLEVLPKEGIQGLSPAHHLSAFIELLSIEETPIAASTTTGCSSDNCNNLPVAWCEKCENLCKSCVESHGRMKATKSHEITYIEEIKSSGRVPASVLLKCPKHGELLKLYCEDCNMIGCGECFDDIDHDSQKDTVEEQTIKRKEKRHDLLSLNGLVKEGKNKSKHLKENQRDLDSTDEAVTLYIENLKMSTGKLSNKWKDIIQAKKEQLQKEESGLNEVYENAKRFINAKENTLSSSAPEVMFKKLMEWINMEDKPPTKPWLSLSDSSANIEMVERLPSDSILVTFPTNPPSLSVGDNFFHVSVINFIPVKSVPQPTITITGNQSECVACIREVGNLTWYVLFHTEDSKVSITVTIDGVTSNTDGISIVLEHPFNDSSTLQAQTTTC